MAETANGPAMTGALLGLHALTSLHPGSGTALGTVDLPVQRERHTQWPTIPGSALKGVLRDACRERTKHKYQDDAEDVEERRPRNRRDKADEDPALVAAFGPPSSRADEHAGALGFTDMRLLAFPVRSLRGLFAWVSCPMILDRLRRDLSLLGTSAPWTAPPSVAGNTALLVDASPCLVERGSRIVLEEFEFAKAEGSIGEVAAWLSENLLPQRESFVGIRKRFPAHFVILSDDDFTHFARHATEVGARIALDYEKKTVKKGALFYQEFLPPETLFYSVVLANGSRARGGGNLLGFLRELLPDTLQIGGDETTGKGLCATQLWTQSK